MKIAIIGKPGSGKTTIFNALTGISQSESDVPKHHLGVIKIPDERLEFLSKAFSPQKATCAEISFIDTAWSQNLSNINHLKDADAVVLAVGIYMELGEYKDIDEITADMMLYDMELIQNRLDRLKKEKKRENDIEYELLLRCQEHLEKELPVREFSLSSSEEKLISGFKLLTLKPLLIVFNLSESQLTNPPTEELKKIAQDKNLKFIEFCAKLEMEIASLDEKERPQFLEASSIKESCINKFIRLVYGVLGLITFFTISEKEIKAWPIRKGTLAPIAAGKVHSDMERGFIRAEVVNFNEFQRYPSFNELKAHGLLRLEGKDYIVQDGDIIKFRFNV